MGAGPAGAITGLVLARHGLDVLLLDRAAFPRAKPCGDCLSAAATGLLERLGLLGRVRDAGAAEIEAWRIISPDGGVATGRFPTRPALALERRLLDATLLDAARDAGARFRRAHVTALHRDDDRNVQGVVTRGGEVLGAGLVVGADGLRSVVARELGVIRRSPRRRKVSLTAHPPAATDPNGHGPGGSAPDGHEPGRAGGRDDSSLRHGEMHVLDGGCIGVAPAGRGRINLTLVVDQDRADGLREQGAEAFFRSWLRRVPSLQDRLGDRPLGPLLASGPFDWPTRSPVADGAALVGDAAGYYDPFTGQGIYHAMAGGEMLAEAVAPVLASGTPGALDRALGSYAAGRTGLTRPVRRVQRVVDAVVSRPWLANIVLRRLDAASTAMDRLIEVTGDLRPPRSLLSPAVVSSLVSPRTRSANDPQ